MILYSVSGHLALPGDGRAPTRLYALVRAADHAHAAAQVLASLQALRAAAVAWAAPPTVYPIEIIGGRLCAPSDPLPPCPN